MSYSTIIQKSFLHFISLLRFSTFSFVFHNCLLKYFNYDYFKIFVDSSNNFVIFVLASIDFCFLIQFCIFLFLGISSEF